MMENSLPSLIEVQPITGLLRQFTYKVPSSLVKYIRVGMLVHIPFGRRQCLGIVSRLGTDQRIAYDRLKSVHEICYDQPILTADLIKLANWMTRYYAASVESTYETLIPAVIRKGANIKVKRYLEVAHELSLEDVKKLEKKAPKQAVLYKYLLQANHQVERRFLCQKLELSDAVLKALVEKGVLKESVKQHERVAYNDALSQAEAIVSEIPTLTEEQAQAYQDIKESLSEDAFKVHLLHGVTGSGKTEVYLRAMHDVLEAGGSVLFMVPEIVLTPQTVSRVRGRLKDLGLQSVVWHSHLSDGERLDAWLAMARGDARVVVGARSAAFAPLKNLKLIIVDEEHEPSFKQEETPRYNGRDVAIYRAMLNRAVCILGSATPSLESLFNVKTKGYKVNRLTKRVDDRQLPLVHVVDMKMELVRKGGSRMVSKLLADKMRERFEAKEQTILFLNRRGYSSSMLCPECGHMETCPHCSISLTYHRHIEELKCHLCGYTKSSPSNCPSCKSTDVRWKGFGTQRIEDIVQAILPKASIARMDADALSKKNRFREILADFKVGKYDILIGTQMIAKGLDFPNVTLVGIIDADISMYVQDFRSSERTFQLLVQVAGRAGRGDRAGEVVVQTFSPHSDPIQFSRRQDFDGFLEGELNQRKEYNYPPYRHIVRHLFRGRNPDKVSFFAEQWVKYLDQNNMGQHIEIRGPSPAPIEKIKDYYRYHIWYFTGNVSHVLPSILELRDQFKIDQDVIDVFDVDPVDLT